MSFIKELDNCTVICVTDEERHKKDKKRKIIDMIMSQRVTKLKDLY